MMLHHGDCLDILPTLPDASVDAVICDPPYGTTACKWDSPIPFEPMWRELKRVIKPRGAVVLFGSQPFTSALVMSNPGWFREEVIWEKDCAANFASAQRVALKYHETIIVFSAGSSTYNPQMWEANKPSNVRGGVGFGSSIYGAGGVKRLPSTASLVRHPRSIVRFATPKHNSSEGREHPTQKPVALMEYLVRTYTDAGDVVLDFTMGSGTTGVACVNTGRRFIGIERDAGYFAIAERRIAEAAMQTRMAV